MSAASILSSPGQRQAGGRHQPHVVLSLVGVVVLAAVWELAGRLNLFPGTLPPFTEVVGYLLADANRAIFENALLATAVSAGQGFLLGSAVAALCATAAEFLLFLRPGMDRLFAVMNALPLVALGPLFIVTIGPGETPAGTAAMAVAFTVYVAVTSGLRRDRGAMTDVMRVLGSSRWALFRHVRAPAAVPTVVDGLTLAAPTAILGALLGEWFGATQGLGVVIVSAMENFQIDLLWATALLSAAMSLAVFGILRAVERYVNRWFA